MSGGRRAWALRALTLAVGAVVVLGLPHVLGDFSDAHALDLALVAVYFVALLGLSILTGFTGQISLGHGAFMAIGGYTTAILVSDQGLSLAGHTFSSDLRDLATILLGALVAGLAGFLVGLPALRIRGLHLALATFALAVALPPVLRRFEGTTGGGGGINIFGLPGHTGDIGGVDVLGRHLTWNEYVYYLFWAIAGVLLVVAWLLVQGRTGRAFRALRDGETAATAFGVSPATYKTLAFALSAAYAGVAGSLLAIHTTSSTRTCSRSRSRSPCSSASSWEGSDRLRRSSQARSSSCTCGRSRRAPATARSCRTPSRTSSRGPAVERSSSPSC